MSSFFETDSVLTIIDNEIVIELSHSDSFWLPQCFSFHWQAANRQTAHCVPLASPGDRLDWIFSVANIGVNSEVCAQIVRSLRAISWQPNRLTVTDRHTVHTTHQQTNRRDSRVNDQRMPLLQFDESSKAIEPYLIDDWFNDWLVHWSHWSDVFPQGSEVAKGMASPEFKKWFAHVMEAGCSCMYRFRCRRRFSND